MNISLTPELQRFVDEKVKSGEYRSPSDVVREGLRLLEEDNRLRPQRLDEVRKKIQLGLDQLDRGEGMLGEQVYEEMKRKCAAFRHRGQTRGLCRTE